MDECARLRKQADEMSPTGTERIGWEYRFFDTSNEPHHWTDWEPLKPKFRGHEQVQEMRDYIASGYRYQMRPIYAGPADGWSPDGQPKE